VVADLTKLGAHTRLREYRGCTRESPIARQMARLRRSRISWSAPRGRVLEHLGKGTLTLRSVHMLVLDDARSHAEDGLRPEVEQILVRTPSTRQTALFSAGLPDPIRAMIGRYLRNPIWVTPEPGQRCFRRRRAARSARRRPNRGVADGRGAPYT